MIAPRKRDGAEFVVGKNYVLFSTGVLVPRPVFDSWTGDISGNADRYLVEHPDAGARDWRYALSTGLVRYMKGCKPKEEAQPELPVLPQEPEPALPERELPIEAPPEKRDWSNAVLSAIMLTVGVGSALMSDYHTTSFLLNSGKPAWASFVIGFMLILFSSTSFTASRFFFVRRRYPVGILFIVAGVAVIAYSMFSTVTVNFDQFTGRDAELKTEAVLDSSLVEAHEKSLALNLESIKAAQDEIARLESEAEYWKEKSWRRYDSFQAEIASAKAVLGGLRRERAILESEKPEVIETAAARRETVYSFLARLVKLPEDAARFFTYVVPALLFDILSPFSLTVVFILDDERRRKYVAET